MDCDIKAQSSERLQDDVFQIPFFNNVFREVEGVITMNSAKFPWKPRKECKAEWRTADGVPLDRVQDCRDYNSAVRIPCGLCANCRARGVGRESCSRASLEEFSADETAMLTEVLRIDVNGWSSTDHRMRVRQLSLRLPAALRRRKLMMGLVRLNGAGNTPPLCEWHEELNHALVHDILSLVDREVTGKLELLSQQCPDAVQPKEAEMVRALEAMRGMWTKPYPPSAVLPGAWDYQANQCDACMLSRIASDTEPLRLLRSALLSRTRTRRKHRAPRLLKFVDACIALHDLSTQIWYESGLAAFGLKNARKNAVRKLVYQHKHGRKRGGRRCDAECTEQTAYVAAPSSNPSRQTGQATSVEVQLSPPISPLPALAYQPELPEDKKAKEEIIKIYASTEVSEMLGEMENLTPSASREFAWSKTQKAAGGSSETANFQDFDGVYEPPRANANWKPHLHQFDELYDDSTVVVPEGLRWSKANTSESTGSQISSSRWAGAQPASSKPSALEYRLPFGVSIDRDSSSQYSGESWTDASVHESSSVETTWVLTNQFANHRIE